ncbi:hypothetical protein FNYG_08615 [Fusarium nygamai]|uniref:Uncharacterized protein n=1 Tax=Gibberella nygamai TaxID=42673 RepID=A0A2K0W6I3_GIBNY|nr:hypothetical protein FNYG_08615 [Fusarium nygamai]
MSRTPNTPARTFQIRSNGLFKKGNTLFNLLHPRVMILIQPGDDVIPGSGEPLAYASHRKEEWPELYDFFESAGVRPRKILGPDDFDTVAARQSSTPRDRIRLPNQQRDTPFPEMPHQPDFFRLGPESLSESLSSDSCRDNTFSEASHTLQPAALLAPGVEGQASDSLRGTPVPDMTSGHYPAQNSVGTEQDFEQSLLSLLDDPYDHKLEAQVRPDASQRSEQLPKSSGRSDDSLCWSREATPQASNKRRTVSGPESMRKRRSMAGPDDRDRRRRMMTRSQGHSFYSKLSQ